jgi:PAS domain S-box-containing protein
MKQWDDIHGNLKKTTEKVSSLENIRHIGEIFRKAGDQLYEFGDIDYLISCSLNASAKNIQIEGVSGKDKKLEEAIRKLFHNQKAPYLCVSDGKSYKSLLRKSPIYSVQKGLAEILGEAAEPEIIKLLENDLAAKELFALPVNWGQQFLGVFYLLTQEPIPPGKALYLINYVREVSLIISQRIFQMEAIQNSQYYRILVQQSSDLQMIVQNERLLFYNQIVPRFTGYSHSELRSRPIFSLLHPDELKKIRILIKNSRKSDEPLRFVTRVIIKSGEIRYIDLSLTNLKKEIDNLFIITGRDISAHIQTQQALIRSENLHRIAINSLEAAIVVSDAQKRILLYNQAFIQFLNLFDIRFSELKGVSAIKIFSHNWKEIAALYDKASADDQPLIHKLSQTLKGEQYHLQISITPLFENEHLTHYVTVIQDLTNQVQLTSRERFVQSRMLEQERLSSVSLLAGGVAHEVNNPITGIINYATLIESRITDPMLKKFAQGIQKEGERVTELVRNLLSFARQDKSETESYTVEEIIRRALMLIESHMRRDGIIIEIEIEEDIPQIICNIENMKQVLLNILFNAREALNTKPQEPPFEKKITIKAEKQEPHLILSITDNGIGIPPSILGHIFTPFFTTKAQSEATGLGLSVAYGIITELGGSLSAESKSGQFSRFIIRLPLKD